MRVVTIAFFVSFLGGCGPSPPKGEPLAVQGGRGSACNTSEDCRDNLICGVGHECEETETPSPASAPGCRTDADCGARAYCLQGRCLERVDCAELYGWLMGCQKALLQELVRRGRWRVRGRRDLKRAMKRLRRRIAELEAACRKSRGRVAGNLKGNLGDCLTKSPGCPATASCLLDAGLKF